MDTWYRLSLGDGVMASGPSAEIEASFQKSFREAGSPTDMAIFTRAESEGRVYCEIIAYFSPAAHDLAKTLDAQACGIPEKLGLRLLAGVSEAWTVLFEE